MTVLTGLAWISLANPTSAKRQVRGISPHRFRDAFATMAVKKDDSMDNLRLLQERLGHASITTTMRYRKVSGVEHREWYDRLWQDPGDTPDRAPGDTPDK